MTTYSSNISSCSSGDAASAMHNITLDAGYYVIKMTKNDDPNDDLELHVWPSSQGDAPAPINESADYTPEQQIDQQIMLYPNPNEGDFVIKTSSEWIGGKAIITDVTGREIGSEQIQGSVQNFKLDLSQGIYFINFVKGEKQEVRKFIIQK